MDAFLTRFLSEVRRNLGDPSHSKRLTDAQLLSDLKTAETKIWERLLLASGQESSVGRAEATIVLEDGVEAYLLPPNFRQFSSFRRWPETTATKATITSGDWTLGALTIVETNAFLDYVWKDGDELVITSPSTHAGTYGIASMTDKDTIVLDETCGADGETEIVATIARTVPDKSGGYLQYYNSISAPSPGPGVEILSSQRGMIVRPQVVLTTSQNWTMVYQKGPTELHYGTAAAVSANTLTFDATPTAGEVVKTDGYYNGSLVHCYSADLGARQVRQIVNYDSATNKVELKHAWDPTPTGTQLYEILPALPNEYDSIYALDVAMKNCPARRVRIRAELRKERREQWEACMRWVVSNVRDRGPNRNLPVREDEDDPYDANVW